MHIPDGWEMKEGKLVREYTFANFDDAIVFMNAVASIATKLNHHPEIYNIYNRVTLTLSTHDAGDIVTEKDIELAEVVNNI